MAGTLNPVTVIVLAFLALCALCFFGMQTQGIQVPELASPDWNLVSSASAETPKATDYQPTDPSQFNLPDPNEHDLLKKVCKVVADITKIPCKWETYQAKTAYGHLVVKAKLVSGDATLAEIEAMDMPLTEVTELGSESYGGATHGWFTYIKVAQWLTKLGMGRLMWETCDHILVVTSQSVFGETQALHIFVDAAGWGESLLASVPDKLQVTSQIWLYFVK